MGGKLNIAVFASGRGSNFQAILRAIKDGTISNASVVMLVSDRRDAGAVELAQNEKIPTCLIYQKQFNSEKEFSRTLLDRLESNHANFIVLAGYLKKIPTEIIRRFRNRILNIHPALLPDFGGKGMYGMRVHETVIASGARMSGATVHIVDEEYDAGPIVLQRKVNIDSLDTPESLAAKVLDIEHVLYPKAINLFANGRVKLKGTSLVVIE